MIEQKVLQHQFLNLNKKNQNYEDLLKKLDELVIIEDFLNEQHKLTLQNKEKYYEYYKEIDPKYSKQKYLNNKKIIFLDDNLPQIYKQGRTQLILKLNETKFFKLPVYKASDYYLLGFYPKLILESYENLKSIYDKVVEHEFFYGKIDQQVKIGFEKYDNNYLILGSIVPDLTEKGKYKVDTYTKDNVLKLNNSKEVQEEFLDIFNKIKSYQNGNFLTKKKLGFLIPIGHINKYGNIDEAVERLFFIKTDQYNKGELLIGDLDHLFIQSIH